MASRVSVPVDEPELLDAIRHPEAIGMESDTPAGRVLAAMARDGVLQRRQQLREQRDDAAFASYAQDPDAEASVLALQEAAVRGRVF